MRGTRGLDHPPCSQWNSDYRLSRVKTGHQVCLLPSPDPSLSPYTCLSLEWALIRLQAGRLEECTMRTGVAQRYRYVLYTHHQANLTVVSCSTVRLSHSLANPRGSLNTRAVFMGGGGYGLKPPPKLWRKNFVCVLQLVFPHISSVVVQCRCVYANFWQLIE